jgi:hypothetical protein
MFARLYGGKYPQTLLRVFDVGWAHVKGDCMVVKEVILYGGTLVCVLDVHSSTEPSKYIFIFGL